jgi:hypothetical protein
MQLHGAPPSSGKLGGAVATRTVFGTRLHLNRPHTQPRSPAQTNARALTGALAGIWRALPSQVQAAWALAAAPSHTGPQLFNSCNRTLMTLGLGPALLPPPPRPPFPSILGFTVTPLYSAPTLPRTLYAWQIDCAPELDGSAAGILRATQCLSPAKRSIRTSDLRIVAVASPLHTPVWLPAASWYKAWGAGPNQGLVTFTLTLVDPHTGIHGTPARASALYSATPTPTPTPWAVTYEQEGTAEAQTQGIVYTQDGDPIAGP